MTAGLLSLDLHKESWEDAVLSLIPLRGKFLFVLLKENEDCFGPQRP